MLGDRVVEAAHTLEQRPPQEEIGGLRVAVDDLPLVVLEPSMWIRAQTVRRLGSGEAEAARDDVEACERIDAVLEPFGLRPTVGVAESQHASS